MSADTRQKYSPAFEDAVARYVTGDAADRSEKTMLEIYTKLDYAKSFFEFCHHFVDLSGKRFIEIGCGTGYVSVAATQTGATVTSTDFEQVALDLTRQRLREHGLPSDVFVSDLREPPAPHRLAAFDFVFCFQVLEHIPRKDQWKALSNLFKMVARGGYLFIDTENSLCPYDRHDTKTWLLRLMNHNVADRVIAALGKGINFREPSTGTYINTRDYLSYDEIIGAAMVNDFEIVNAFMPHGTKATYLRTITGSDWLHDNILQYFDIERYSPVSLLLHKCS